MNRPKYIAAAAQIEKSLKHGFYRDRLPTVHELAAATGVSLQTMTRALALLKERCLIRTSARGTFKVPGCERRLYNHVVGICCGNLLPLMGGDPLIRELTERIRRDGDEPLLLGVSAELRKNIGFWHSGYVDGYIFVYSSFDSDFAAVLRNGLIPCVVANRVAGEAVNWIDWNQREIFDAAIGALVAAGYRSIAVFSQRSARNPANHAELYRDIRAVKRDYQLPLLATDHQVVHNLRNQLGEALKMLLSLPVFPEALIVNGAYALRLVEALRLHHREAGRDYQLVLPLNQDCPYPVFGRIAALDYAQLAKTVWTRFQQVRANPSQVPEGRFINVRKSFIRNDEFIKKHLS